MSGVFRGIVDRFLGLVETLNGLTGAINISSPDGSITVTASGNNIYLTLTPVAAVTAAFSYEDGITNYTFPKIGGTIPAANYSLVL